MMAWDTTLVVTIHITVKIVENALETESKSNTQYLGKTLPKMEWFFIA